MNSAKPEQYLDALATLPMGMQERVAYNLGTGGSFDETKRLTRLDAWLGHLTDPVVRNAAISGAGQTMVGYENDAEAFMGHFTEPAEKDAALRGLSMGYRSSGQKQKAAAMAASIGDTALRQQVLDSFVVDWLRAEPKGAEKFLNSTTGLAPEWVKAWREEAAGRL